MLAMSLAVVTLAVAGFASPVEAQDCNMCKVTSIVDPQGYPQNEAACVSTSFDIGSNTWLLDCVPRADCTGCTGDVCPGTYPAPNTGDDWPAGPLDTLTSCNQAGGMIIHVISAEYSTWDTRCIYPWI